MPGLLIQGIKYIYLCNNNDFKKNRYMTMFILH